MLGCPPLAEQAARSAAHCEYLIVSLRGDHILSIETRRWIEAQLDSVSARGAWVIGLLGFDQGKRRVLQDNRAYLNGVCAAKGVDFFSLAPMQAPGDSTDGLLPAETAQPEQWEPRWMETLLCA